MWAPASTWAIVSRSTRLKSPAFISSARAFRPVGLMRSPMMTNGRSSPMTTSRVADETTVWVIPGACLPVVSSWAGGNAGPPSTPPDWISSARWCLSYVVSSRSTSALTSASRSSPQPRATLRHSSM